MSEFSKIFKKVNGMQQLKQYAKAHVLLHALVQTAVVGVSKKSLEIVRLSVRNKILQKLRKKNKKFIADCVDKLSSEVLEKKHEKRIWIAWFQGIEQAPYIVKRCYQSIVKQFGDYEITVITDENYADYVVFPEYIVEKYQKGLITKTHFSDLLRIELLSEYGGTWIDATVFCSGGDIPKYMLESDLFLFQILKPGLDGCSTAISSWFITASSDSKIIRLVRELLYNYWRHANSLIDYFLIHDFFQLAIEAFPEEWKEVIPVCNSLPHILQLNFFERYDEEKWEAIRNMTPFHKLSYKWSDEQLKLEKTFYQKIVAQ